MNKLLNQQNSGFNKKCTKFITIFKNTFQYKIFYEQ